MSKATRIGRKLAKLQRRRAHVYGEQCEMHRLLAGVKEMSHYHFDKLTNLAGEIAELDHEIEVLRVHLGTD